VWLNKRITVAFDLVGQQVFEAQRLSPKTFTELGACTPNPIDPLNPTSCPFGSGNPANFCNKDADLAQTTGTVPLSSTSANIAITLMWPDTEQALRLTVTPPGRTQPIVKESASGFISMVEELPMAAPFDDTKDWSIKIEPANTHTEGGTQNGVPFDLHIMTDDAGIKTDLKVVPQDYRAGDQIRLQAKLTRFGLPIQGIGSRAGDFMKVDLVKPGQSVGDVLSDSRASATPPAGSVDVKVGLDAKLFNTIKDNPSAFKKTSEYDVKLYDDGNKAEHGDDVAGDRTYNALYAPALPGHYNFLFSSERTDLQGWATQNLLRALRVGHPSDHGYNFPSSSRLAWRREAARSSSVVKRNCRALPRCVTW